MTQLLLVSIALLATLAPGRDGVAQDNFYKGKTIRIVVGGSAGGGYDTYSRTLARHWGKHIPGNPTFVVDNMPGAGSIISANHVYKVSKPDGLTMCHPVGGILLQNVLGKAGIEFDGRKFLYIGAPMQDTLSAGVAKSTGITSIEQWLASKTPVKFGGIGPGTGTDDVAKVMRFALGLPIQVITGYKGTADIRLAVQSGEMQGLVNSWESFKATWSKEVETGAINVIMVSTPKRHSELPNVPSIGEFVKNEEAKRIVQVAAYDYGATARPYMLPPNTPKERLQILRRAFQATLKDPDFLADAQRARLDMNPLTGDEMQEAVERLWKLDKPLVEKLKEILK